MFLNPPPPWHLRPIAFLAVLWGGAGAADHLLRQLGLAGRYPDGAATVWAEAAAAFPAWAATAWAVGVWAGLLGAVLLWMRERFAPIVLAVAALGVILALIGRTIGTDPGTDDPVVIRVMAGSGAFALLLWLYARRMRRNAVLGTP